MQAGRLTERVTLETVTVTRDVVGGPVETWAVLDTVWAEVKPLTGKQIAQAQQVGAALSKAVTIRYRSGITSALRVRFFDGATAKVQWVEEHRREDRIVLIVEDRNG